MRADFVAVNDYTWCTGENLEGSQWQKKTKLFANYSIPIFFSEFGCIANPPRQFHEIKALYSPNMTPVFSGGLVYEYSMNRRVGPNAEARFEYGLVEIKNDTNTITELDDFKKVQTLFGQPLPNDVGGYKASGKPSACPRNSSKWDPIPPPAAKDGVKYSSVPSMPQDAEEYMRNGAGTAPGFKGKGSHDEIRMGGAKSQGWNTVAESDNSGTSTISNSSSSTQSPTAKNGGTVLASSSIGMLLFGTALLAAMQSLSGTSSI